MMLLHMHENASMGQVFLHALLDSLKVFAVAFLIYVLLTFIENKIAKMLEKRNKFSPLLGALFGLVPQCGISVVGADLYTKDKISMGTLIALFISCSDEALPILLTSGSKAIYAVPLLILKFTIALIVGVVTDLIYFSLHRKKVADVATSTDSADAKVEKTELVEDTCCAHEHLEEHEDEEHEHEEHEHEDHEHEDHEHDEHECCHHHDNDDDDECEMHIGCCHHGIEKDLHKTFFGRHFIHPLIHSLKLLFYVLIINFVFSFLMYYITEEALVRFLEANKYLSPLVAVLIGMIPNCVSSVILTEVYLLGGIPFGACLAGLCINAGLGLIFLFKSKKSVKHASIIMGILFGVSLFVGYFFTLVLPF